MMTSFILSSVVRFTHARTSLFVRFRAAAGSCPVSFLIPIHTRLRGEDTFNISLSISSRSQLCSEFDQLLLIGTSVSEVEKLVVARMRPRPAVGVLDRTEVLLGTRGDLAHVSDQPVGVAAVVAVEPLDPVEVLEMASVQEHIP